jgi:hypothetical protein
MFLCCHLAGQAAAFTGGQILVQQVLDQGIAEQADLPGLLRPAAVFFLARLMRIPEILRARVPYLVAR